MQSVVTGQAPTSLEWKITSGGKQIRTEDNTHNNWNKSYTYLKQKKGEISVRTYYDTYIYMVYAKRVAAETETKETALW